MTPTWRLGRRPALTGIRGIAIVLVVVCHVSVPKLYGAGPVGVTVFFTLSGFLITALLLEEASRSSGRINMRRFYVHRFRRLAPAAAVNIAVAAIVALVLAGWWLEWSDIPPALFYYANWSLASGGDLGALGGYWSLSIEEQFYLVWPLLVFLGIRQGGGWVVLSFAVVGVALSVAVRAGLYHHGASYERVYYGSDAVASALFVGAVGAAWLRTGTMPKSPPGAFLVGLLAIAYASTLTDKQLWYGAPLLAAGGTALLIWATATTTDEDAGPGWLKSRVLVYLGERSYSLYLWHIGLAWALRTQTHLPWQLIALIVIPISLASAECSYRFVEQPLRARTAHAPSAEVAGTKARSTPRSNPRGS